jgi:phospholipase C
MDTRRDFLKKAILLSGATGLSGAMPSSIQRALAIDPDPGSTFLDAEHVVILMQENRAFDHCFGALRGVRGFNDPRTIAQPNGNRVWVQTDRNGDAYVPFRFDIQHSKVTWMGSLPHSRASQVDAFNKGKYDQWLNAKRSGDKKYENMPLTLGHYIREDLPFNYALADAFTICDQNFCSAMTSTWPNRLFFWSGTVRAEKNGETRAYMNNEIPYGEAHWETFPELLEKNDISWKVYQNDLSAGGGLTGDQRAWLANFGCNPLEFLSQFNVRFFPRYYQGVQKRAEELPGQIAELEKKLSAMQSGDKGYDKLQREIAKKKEVLDDAKQQLIKWHKDNFEKLSSYEKNLYYKAFTTNADDPEYHDLTTLQYEDNGQQREVVAPKGDVLYQFRKDVEKGNLPTVSWLVPSQNFSDHPSAPWYGVWLTSEILDILTQKPDVWKKTIFILTYDENDGYFDHIPPFTAPDPQDKETGKCSPGVNVTGEEYTRQEQQIKYGWTKRSSRTAPVGLGFRVPLIVASPWSRGGKVCSQVFDHTSTLQFLEEFLNKKYNKNIRQENISEWRRTVCGNLTAAFSRFEEGKDKLPFLKMDPFIERIYNAKFTEKPTGYKKLTDEEIAAINRDPASSPLMALQEPGTRPACPLPYQLYAEGELSSDRKTFQLNMQAKNEVFGKEAAGSPFKVYAPGNYISREDKSSYEAARSWDYAVTAGDALADAWPLKNFEHNLYHLRVYGPNGFYREFKGDAGDPSLQITCDYERVRLMKNRLTGNIELRVKNMDVKQAHQITVTDNAYKHKPVSRTVPAGQEITVILDLKKSHSWYDFNVAVQGNKSFGRSYAGRIETGKESFSDPAMGRSV